MEVLMIGMDGCHKDVFARGWTPFVSELLKSHQHLEIENDLLSRGWLEISVGEHASMTSALYDQPKSNGALSWSTEFSLPDVPNLGVSVKTLWQKLNEMGVSIGVVNVPTTFPAPEVNGFFISGGGGGAPVAEAATEALCFPKDILPVLHEMDYIVDDRLYQLVVDKGLDTPDKILRRLAYKNDRRTQSFLALNERFDVDFGFIVYKTASVVAETLLNTELCRRGNKENQPDHTLIDAVREYYRDFDQQIKTLVEANPSAEVIFVSDHGTIQRTHSVNPNILLQQHGLQRVETKKAFVKLLVTKLKELIPFSAKAWLKKSAVMKMKDLGAVDFVVGGTLAFCKTTGDWSHGIYIHDATRFGGPVLDEDFDTIRDQIVTLINEDPTSKAHGITARATAKAPRERSNFFPDIAISMPNGYLTFDKAKAYVNEFRAPISKSSLASIMKGDILSVKSHSPLAYMSEAATARFKPEQLRGDLTVIHHRILDTFQKLNATKN